MKRREFLTLVGGVAAGWPFAARAQQPAIPVVGFLQGLSSSNMQLYAASLRQGLKEAGYVEGQNVAIEYRSAEGQYERLPGLIADLIGRKVAVIFASGGTEPAKQAKAATSTIPIVFTSGADPVKAGLVASFNRPGGNVTGVSLIGSALEAKRLELLHQIVPASVTIGALVNPKYPDAEMQARELQDAAAVIGRKIEILRVSTDAELDAAPSILVEKNAGAFLVTQDVFFNSRREKLVTLAARHKLPAIYNQREYAEIGGLMSYGTDFRDGYRQGGVYVGKILGGTRPADLPVLQPTKFELAINSKTAKALGLEIPPKLLFTADEVIE
jgi:putative ABC transport system substrate-binding protein